MEHEIMSILELIKEKTGKSVDVYMESDDGVYFTSDGEEPKRAEYRINGVISDTISGRTYFRFKHKAESFIGYLNGCGEAEKDFAALSVALFENGVIKESSDIKADSLISIILGEEREASVRKYAEKFKVSEKPCAVFVIKAQADKLGDIVSFLGNFSGNSSDLTAITGEELCAYIKFLDSPVGDAEQSVAEYASLLSQSLYEELGFTVAIGVGSTASGFSECAVSYKRAVSALKMAETFAVGAKVVTYKEFVLVKMLEDLPKYKLREYLDVLAEPEAKNLFSDGEMLFTAEEFFNNDLNVSETSRKLFMHRNTLMYRLDKIDKDTGLDIRKFKDAVTFKVITILYKLLGHNTEK